MHDGGDTPQGFPWSSERPPRQKRKIFQKYQHDPSTTIILVILLGTILFLAGMMFGSEIQRHMPLGQ